MAIIRMYDLYTFESVGYLKAFDLEAHDGRGEIIFTPHESEAMVFENFHAAMEAWRTTSKTHPTRPDGKPNRPLTAYTAEILN